MKTIGCDDDNSCVEPSYEMASTQFITVVAGSFLSRTNESLIFSGYVDFTWSHGFIQCCRRNSLQLLNLNISLCSEIITDFLEYLPKLAVERVASCILFGSKWVRITAQEATYSAIFLGLSESV